MSSSTSPKPKATAPIPSKASLPRPEAERSPQSPTSISTSVPSSSSSSKSQSESESESDAVFELTTSATASPSTSSSNPGRLTTIKYQPPPRFTPLTLPPSTSMTNPFSTSNLRGKELWVITSPSSIPLATSTLPKLISVTSLKNNYGNSTPILEHKNRKYHLISQSSPIEQETESGLRLLLPNANEKTLAYQLTAIPISRTLALTEIPPLSTFHHVSPVKNTSPIEQPKGLKMRYHPFGAGHPIKGMERGLGNINGVMEDVEMVDIKEDKPKEKKRKTKHEEGQAAEHKHKIENGHSREKKKVKGNQDKYPKKEKAKENKGKA